MKKLILSVFGIFSLVAVNGQKAQTVDSAYFQAFYKFKYVKDLLRPERSLNDETILTVGESTAAFFSYTNFIADSLQQTNPDEYTPSVTNNGGVISAVPAKTSLRRSANDLAYFFDKKANKYSCLSKVKENKYGYTVQYRKPEWKISGDTARVLGRLCQKASSVYGGRTWTVWFAQEIPVSEGPWKLKGLPGLILKAEDDSKSVIFECTGFSRLNQKKPIVQDNTDRKTISKKDFVKLYVDFFNDPFKDLLPEGAIITDGATGRVTVGKRKLNVLEKDGV